MGPKSAVKRRVVVTGMGAVSPNGIGREAFWNATRLGRAEFAASRASTHRVIRFRSPGK